MNENGFTSFLLGLVAAAALFLIWKKEHTYMTISNSGISPQPSNTIPVAQSLSGDGAAVCGTACGSCGVSVPIPVNQPIQTAQVSPTSGGSFPSVVPSVPRAPVNTIRIGVQYTSPPRAAATTPQAVRTPYTQQTSPLTIPTVGQMPLRLGPSTL
jgi:hypothetical protein